MQKSFTPCCVGDMQRSIDFYTKVMGVGLLRTPPTGPTRNTRSPSSAGQQSQGAVLELTYNYGVASYDLGAGYGHIAIEVSDAAAACERIRTNGGAVTREAGPVKGGTTVIAFVQDPRMAARSN